MELNQLKNTWALGSCNTGSCDSFEFIAIYPDSKYTENDVKNYCG